MKTLRPQKRSVSPFGFVPTKDDPFGPLTEAFKEIYPPPAEKIPSSLKTLYDAGFIPKLIQKIAAAPASDAPQLDHLCQFLLRFQDMLVSKGLDAVIEDAMMQLFERKTELFMLDQQEGKEVILFSKERDALVGRYFAPLTEAHPGKFSEFVTAWMESDNPDRTLHFLDFCAGSNNPTFEHYLLFTHPALHRIVSNKDQIRGLFHKTAGPLSKLSSPTWEQNVRRALGV